jgi:hypothetical protein
VLRSARLAACLAGLAALACAGAAQVDFDPAHDFRRARTWDWLPIDEPAGQYMEDVELRDRIGEVVARELQERGFARSRRPDLHVTCKLALTREQVVRKETPPLAFLPSLHGGEASYEVQGAVEQLIVYETAHLVIEISDARSGRVVWSGSADRRVRGRFLPRAERTISELLANFPPPLQAAL